MRVVVALGGNAILPAGADGTADEQRATVAVACAGLADLVDAGHQLVVTHGNGPQVGGLLLQQRAGRLEIPEMPLDVLVAQTQGQIGYLVAQQLGNELRRRRRDRPVVTVVTQVVVDADDPAFSAPDKPVGPRYTETEVEYLRRRDDGGDYRRGDGGVWRRVVPSPSPRDVIEAPGIGALLEAGAVPVCAGGGGVPVTGDGACLSGLEAVIDKDRTAALLVRLLSADALLILTDVEAVMLDRGTDRERPVRRMTVAQARRGLRDGQFPAGSMGPKVEAAIEAASTGAAAVITSLQRAGDALAGRAGTIVVAG